MNDPTWFLLYVNEQNRQLMQPKSEQQQVVEGLAWIAGLSCLAAFFAGRWAWRRIAARRAS